jgi:hypothetical protein
MTKRDYQMLADIISFTQDQYFKGRIPADDILPTVVRMFVDEEKVRNPRFNEDTFIKACGT